jgi:hypothetical protein
MNSLYHSLSPSGLTHGKNGGQVVDWLRCLGGYRGNSPGEEALKAAGGTVAVCINKTEAGGYQIVAVFLHLHISCALSVRQI